MGSHQTNLGDVFRYERFVRRVLFSRVLFWPGVQSQRQDLDAPTKARSSSTLLAELGTCLVAFARGLKSRVDPLCTLREWNSRILGRDLHPEFVKAAKIRLALTALQSARRHRRFEVPDTSELFAGIKAGCSLDEEAAFKLAMVACTPISRHL
jgi:hypothetical protein